MTVRIFEIMWMTSISLGELRQNPTAALDEVEHGERR